MKERIVYLDRLKAAAIFFICCIHYVMLKPSYFDNFIDMFMYNGVAVFFMVHGALLLNQKYAADKHKKRTIKMLAVLLAWETISLVYFSVLYGRNMSGFTWQDILSYFFGCIRWELPTGHFWFVAACISIYILFPM